MGKLQDLIAKAISDSQSDINAGVAAAIAKAPAAQAPKPSGQIGTSHVSLNADQERVMDVAFIAKTLRGGTLLAADIKELEVRAKAVGVTGDVASLLPDGFSGTLIRDVQSALNVGKLFPMRTIKGGIAHDTVALYGITAYLTSEANDGTDSAESYKTFVATTQKIMAVVRKSYEVIDDSLIDLADEVHQGLVRAIAEGVELAIVNGDIAGTQDGTTYGATSAARAVNGIRYHGLNKVTVSAAGVDYTAADGGEATFLAAVNAMQLAGGKYLDNAEVSNGNVALIIDQGTYGRVRSFDSFKTKEKAGNVATLFGGMIDTLFGIPVVVTSQLPTVAATGKIDTALPANNTKTSMYMLNINTMRLSANGSIVSELDKNIVNQSYIWTGSLRFGFASIYDSTEAAPNTVTAAQTNVIAGINLAK